MIDTRLAKAVLCSPGHGYGAVVIGLGMLTVLLAREIAGDIAAVFVVATTVGLLALSAFLSLYPRGIAAREAAYKNRLADVFHPGVEVHFDHEPSSLPGFDFVTVDVAGRRTRASSESRVRAPLMSGR